MMKLRAHLLGKTTLSFLLMLLAVVATVNGLELILHRFITIEVPWVQFVTGYTLQTVTFLLFTYFWFIRRFPEENQSISFHSPGLGRLLLWIAFIFISYIAFSTVALNLAEYLGFAHIPGFGEQESLLQPLGTGIGLIVAFIIAVFIAPIIEEYIFRGWGMVCVLTNTQPLFITILAAIVVFNWLYFDPSAWIPLFFIVSIGILFRLFLVNDIKATLAILLNGILFALLHFEPNSIIPLIFLGSMLAFTRFRTNSLLPGIVFHMINNSLAFLADYWLK